MNVFSYKLAEGDLPNKPDRHPTKLTIDDNIGESIHIHYRNTRIELSVREFLQLGQVSEKILEEL